MIVAIEYATCMVYLPPFLGNQKKKFFYYLIMEEVAAELDSKFQETEKKLDTVTWKVEQLVKVDTAGPAGNTLSAAQMLTSVQEIRKDFNSLVAEVEQLKSDQQSAMNEILQELRTAQETAEQLQDNLNMPKES